MTKRLEQRRIRKQIERQTRRDLQVIASAPELARQANYRRATELDLERGEKCTLCRFNTRDNFCDLFKFDFVVGFTCDRFEPKEIVTKSLASYRRSITAAARGLWSRNLDVFDFINSMNSAIDRGYEQAWREGARTCDIRPSERTQEEAKKLKALVSIAKSSVFDFGEFIEARQDDPFSSIRFRIDVWANRYNEVKSTGSMMACADIKEIWLIDEEAENCDTCLKLNNRVMRNSRWAELDVVTQDTRPNKLMCKGYNCACERKPTTKRATPGRLPSLP